MLPLDDAALRRLAEIAARSVRLAVTEQMALTPLPGDHPAAFPVALPTAYIEAATNPAGIVIDPFGGSGTTLVAADALGRRARLVELDPAYCDVIRQRYADHANRPDLAP